MEKKSLRRKIRSTAIKSSIVRTISDPYSKRILSNVIDKDPVQVLSRTPKIISALVRGLSKNEIHKSMKKRTWSIAQIMAHLCDSEIVVSYRIRKAIAESGTNIQAFDQNKWAAHLQYGVTDFRAKLALFSLLRQDTIDLLQSLTARQWKLYGIHEERGKETVARMAQMYAGHDVNHIKQIQDLGKTIRGRRGL